MSDILYDERYMLVSAYYYQQNHYHPVYALCGSFGLLIQLLFFITAYSYLSGLESLKGVSFSFIPVGGGRTNDNRRRLPPY